MGHDPIHGDLHAQVRSPVAHPQGVRHRRGLLGLAPGLPALEILGGAVDEALGPLRAEGHARAPLEEIIGHPMGQFCDEGA